MVAVNDRSNHRNSLLVKWRCYINVSSTPCFPDLSSSAAKAKMFCSS
jgi:hypothetical protein